MNAKELLLLEWKHTYDQEDWYPPLRTVLAGLNAAQASWKPAGSTVNSIWENISHLLVYKERMLCRLSGTPFTRQPENNEATFEPSGGAEDEAAWQATVRRLDEVHHQIFDKLSALSEEELLQPLTTYTVQQSAMSLVLHDAYHTGQIVQLRKLQGSWPAQRSEA